MTLTIRQTNVPTADGVYTVRAKGCIAAALYWANESGRLDCWSSLAVIPLSPKGVGEFVFRGSRAIPREATHIRAEAVRADFGTREEIQVPLPNLPRMRTGENDLRCTVFSDLHFSAKPWTVRAALRMAADSDCILLTGDMTNDGTPAQFAGFYEMLTELLPDKPVFAVTGNHDFPHDPIPRVSDGIDCYPGLQDALLRNARRLGWQVEQDNSGAYAAMRDGTEIIGLNAVSHWRRFVFRDGEQLAWLEHHLENSAARRHILLCHAPLLRHNPAHSPTAQPYLSRDRELQNIADRHRNILFLSGHTHLSLNCPGGCAEQDENGNIFLNAGSTCPTALKPEETLQPPEWTDGNGAELLLGEDYAEITGFSVRDQTRISRGYYRFPLCE